MQKYTCLLAHSEQMSCWVNTTHTILVHQAHNDFANCWNNFQAPTLYSPWGYQQEVFKMPFVIYFACFSLVTEKKCFAIHSKEIKREKARRANAQTIHICRTGLLDSHLPYIIDHHKHLSCLIQLNDIKLQKVLDFLWTWGLERTWRSSKLESSCRVLLCPASYHVWNKSIHKCPKTPQC